MRLLAEKKAFTLAEVLVTLAIIGVVASLTIPAVVKSTQEASLRSAFKKQYSDLNQALKMAAVDNGGTIAGLFSDTNSFRDVFLDNLKPIKKCNQFSALGNCVPNSNLFLNGNTANPDNINDMSSAILANGASLRFVYRSSGCTNAWAGLLTCGGVRVDVNGLKGPNTWGKDIYEMYILKDRLVPFGAQEDGDVTHTAAYCTRSTQGWSCAAKVLKNVDY